LQYTNGFKARMVRRMAGPERVSATALSKEVGVSQATLSRWLCAARTVGSMGGGQRKMEGGANSPRHWTAEEKLRVVMEAANLSDDELGAFLRKEGLHETQLEEWRKVITDAAKSALSGSKKRAKASPEAKRIKQLERELNRKEKALAEVAALLALKKKVDEIWGDGDDDTATKNET
jgi:transposase-like protein